MKTSVLGAAGDWTADVLFDGVLGGEGGDRVLCEVVL